MSFSNESPGHHPETSLPGESPHSPYSSKPHQSESRQPIQVICPPPARVNFWPRLLLALMLFIGFGFLALAMMIGMIGVIVVAVGNVGSLPEKVISGEQTATDKIVVLKIEGVIMGGEDSFVQRQIRQAREDDKVKAIVLRIDSPGGTISGSDEYLYALKKLKTEKNIPIVVSMGSLAASGGYYVAMAGDTLFAEPTTTTGSIGVIVPHYNAAVLLDRIGVASDPITSGPYKTMGSFTKPMSDDERQLWQKYVDSGFERFKQVIRDGRPAYAADPAKLDALATGQIYTAAEAKENGLIDTIGYLDEAVEEAATRSGTTDYKVVRYKKSASMADILLGSAETRSPINGPSSQASIQKTISDLTVPRAYYLMPQVLPIGHENE